MLCEYFTHERRVLCDGNVSDPQVLNAAIFAGSTWSGLLLRVVMQDAVKSVLLAFLEGRIRVYVNDIKFFRETRRPHSGRTGTDITFRRSSKIKNWKLEATG